MMKKIFLLLLIIVPFKGISQININYPGNQLPSDSALLFAPGLINTGLFTRDLNMSPDGKEIYFSIMTGQNAFIMVSFYKNGKWGEPEIVSFSGNNQFFDFEPHISADGNRIFFLSTRPKKGQEPKLGWGNQNIWFADRIGNSWSEAREMGTPVNTNNNEFFPSVAENNNLYFTHSTDAKDAALYISVYQNGNYSKSQKLSFGNDSSLMLYNATVSRDESFILTCGSPKDNPRKSAYYISYKLANNSWSNLIDLTSYLGLEGGRVASISLSPDENFIFFSAAVLDEKNSRVYPGMKISEILNNRNLPQNGSSNIYWISSNIIKNIKTEIFNKP